MVVLHNLHSNALKYSYFNLLLGTWFVEADNQAIRPTTQPNRIFTTKRQEKVPSNDRTFCRAIYLANNAGNIAKGYHIHFHPLI